MNVKQASTGQQVKLDNILLTWFEEVTVSAGNTGAKVLREKADNVVLSLEIESGWFTGSGSGMLSEGKKVDDSVVSDWVAGASIGVRSTGRNQCG